MWLTLIIKLYFNIKLAASPTLAYNLPLLANGIMGFND